MNIVGTLKSIENNKDVFGNISPWNIDHVYPISKGGTDCTENRMKLSGQSNSSKGNNTKGYINQIRFSVVKITGKAQSNGDKSIYGELYIKVNKDKDEWYKVIDA